MEWRKRGFIWPRSGTFSENLITDIIISRYLYYEIDKVTFKLLNPTSGGVFNIDGTSLFVWTDVACYITALESALFLVNDKLPLWRIPDAVIFSFASYYENYDPIELQTRILSKLWKPYVRQEHIDVARRQLLGLFASSRTLEYDIKTSDEEVCRKISIRVDEISQYEWCFDIVKVK